MRLYDGEHHRAFSIEGENGGRTGALLLHGFTGTPAEMRPLATALATLGMGVHVPLLPGFGSEIERLGDVKAHDWIDAARRAWDEVEARYDVSFLIGYSMGGALALQVAATKPPRRLVLIAPFWRIADRRAALLPLLKHVKSELQPFEQASFDDPDVRDTFAKIDPTLDLDDPEVQERLRRESTLPLSALVELQRAGREAADLAHSVRVDTLVIQGLGDDTVLAGGTRELVKRMPGEVQLLEVPADHLLIWDDRPAWPRVRDTVIEFLTGQAAG